MIRLLTATVCAIWLTFAPAMAQMGQIPDWPTAFQVSSGGSFSLTFESQSGSASTGTTVNYGTVTWGSGCNAVVFAINWYNTASTDVVSSMSVGVQSASAVANTTIGAAAFQVSSSIWQLTSPSGSSASVSVTYSETTTYNSSVAAYCLVSAHTTVQSSNSGVALSGSNASTAVTVPTGGQAMATGGTTSGGTITWTNATQDAVYTSGGVYEAVAHTTSTGSMTITNTPASGQANVVSAAAYGP